DHHHIAAAVSVTVPAQRVESQVLEDIIAQVCDASARLSQRISHMPPVGRPPANQHEKTAA
ncbi:MAG: hypothetical protein ABIN37_07340, partial [Burkholderiaceae bacterium]